MSDLIPIKRALISVFDKTGVVDVCQTLAGYGVELISTGGTYKALTDAGLNVVEVSEITAFPEMMDGRVKTLHPKIHGGLLGRGEGDAAVMAQHDISAIDLLINTLYPFEDTVAKGVCFEDTVEMIDIGGPAMVRSAAKNHAFVTVVTAQSDYGALLQELKDHGGKTSAVFRKKCAATAFTRTARYDAAISAWFAGQTNDGFPSVFGVMGYSMTALRYGENPHQNAALYLDGSNRPGVATAKQLQGKELSYNNLNDTDAAFALVSEFDQPAIAIIKHANPCGVAQAENLVTAYERALACDPISAFGGIVAANTVIDVPTARKIIETFTEVVIAPEITEEARAVFQTKPGIRVLETGAPADLTTPQRQIKTIAGGLLVQDMDLGKIGDIDLKTVTDRSPTNREATDLLFAWTVCKHVKSNAIVLAKDGATVGIGAGQMSRLSSAQIAAAQAGDKAEGSVVASDAFFPFADGLEVAAKAGVTAVIQPGGSKRDDEVIAAANTNDMAMVFTGMRHFKH